MDWTVESGVIAASFFIDYDTDDILSRNLAFSLNDHSF